MKTRGVPDPAMLTKPAPPKSAPLWRGKNHGGGKRDAARGGIYAQAKAIASRRKKSLLANLCLFAPGAHSPA
jgi:hypothetical protein